MNKKIMVFLCLVLGVFSVIILFGYQRINSKFPRQKEEKYAMNEWTDFEKDIQIRVDKAEMLPYEEPNKQTAERASTTDETATRFVEITFTVKNDSKEEKEIDMVMYLQWHGGAQGADWTREGYSSGRQVFLPGESRKLTYVYNLNKVFFKGSTWENLEELDYELLYSCYPIERTVELVFG